MNNLDAQYQALLEDILQYGVEKEDRTGTGTISVFGRQIRHNMNDGFPLLTTKKMAIKTMMTELKWFLKGDTNIKYLVDNGCNIWNGDTYKNYKSTNPDYLTNDEMFKTEEGTYKFFTQEEFINKIKTDDKFAAKWGELGPIYGKQWRGWKRNATRDEKIVNPGVYHIYIDQIQNLINELKTNPDSRRLMVSAWNVGEMNEMVLPPCHYGFQVYTRELSLEERVTWMKNNKTNVVLPARDLTVEFSINEFFRPYGVPTRAISLMWNQRSVDTFLGLPFNIASYATLLQLIADECDMIAGDLIGNLGDVHLYSNHIEQAKEQISRDWFELPTLELTNVDLLKGEFDYEIKDYKSHPSIKAPLSN